MHHTPCHIPAMEMAAGLGGTSSYQTEFHSIVKIKAKLAELGTLYGKNWGELQDARVN